MENSIAILTLVLVVSVCVCKCFVAHAINYILYYIWPKSGQLSVLNYSNVL